MKPKPFQNKNTDTITKAKQDTIFIYAKVRNARMRKIIIENNCTDCVTPQKYEEPKLCYTTIYI